MYAVESVVLRVSIVLCMVAAVVTVLYFTPLPDNFTESCDRPCKDFDWPMICRYKFAIEKTGSKCEKCSNSSECDRSCSKTIYTINQQLPGPAIHVCQNDIVLIDVTNRIPGRSLSLHFRGQSQEESPFMDGVPMITQCPITSYTTFQYKFRASTSGTHFYSAHSGALAANGIYGALIVRQPARLEPNKRYYDFDEKVHSIMISEWLPGFVSDLDYQIEQPTDILVNGKLKSDPPIFTVSYGNRYRFRLSYSATIAGCPITFSINNHPIKVISVDGNPTNPYEVRSVTLNKGERIDFILKAKQQFGDYFIKFNSTCFPKISGEGIIRYSERNKSVIEEIETETTVREFNTGVCDSKLGRVCIGDIHAVKKIPRVLKDKLVDKKLFFDFSSILIQNEEQGDANRKIHTVNNITFIYPSSPLLTQIYDVPASTLCNTLFLPEKCKHSHLCECTYIENIPLDSTVELIISNQNADASEYIFHLHGYHFYIIGSRQFQNPVPLDLLKTMDENEDLFSRNLINPPLKDTIRVPKFGIVAVRFIANNPGFWMLRDERTKIWSQGLDVVLKVGELRDFISPPSSFPNCGSWIGPEFFFE
nr:laccase-13-like [Onthophagus taurus]